MITLPTVLIFDHEADSIASLQRLLGDDFDVHCATQIDQARAILQREWVHIILCDQRLSDSGPDLDSALDGVEFLADVRRQWPEVIRLLIADSLHSNWLGWDSADPSAISDAVEKAGIYQFVSKPWQAKDLLLTLNNAVQLFELRRRNEQLAIELKLRSETSSVDMVKPNTLRDELKIKRAVVQARYEWDQSIVRSPGSKMDQVYDLIQQVAPFDVNVVLTGESGTGKELCAQALHFYSLRQSRPFVAENCGALPDELLESELFGYKRGAFTGAVEDRTGLFEQAQGGTVFLDEIGDVSPSFQVKLLRVLQEGEIRPLGGSEQRRVDVRVIAATNRDLETEVQAGRFRMDLYYRLATFEVHLPALRERREDIVPIAYRILEQAMLKLGKRVRGFSKEALQCMQVYHWPGNVRELQNEVKRMLVMSHDNELGADLLSTHILFPASAGSATEVENLQRLDGSLKERVEILETRILKETLIRHRWNKTRAAEELGLSRVGLRNKLERYELDKRLNAGRASASGSAP